MRNLDELEQILVQFGFIEMYGHGLWAMSTQSIVADTNSGIVKLIPRIDASSDDFIAFCDDRDSLISELDRLGIAL